MNHQGISIHFHKTMRGKGSLDTRNIPMHQTFQFGIRDVSDSNQQQVGRLTGKQERLHEIIILGHDNALFTRGTRNHLGVRCAVTQWQIQGVPCIMSRL